MQRTKNVVSKTVKSVLLFTMLSLAFAHPSGGQEQKKALTNGDVIKLVKSGFPTNTILLMLNNSDVAFDTSPAALITLKNSGVNETIIDAMLNRKPKSASPTVPDKVGENPPTASEQNLNDEFSKASLRAIDGELHTANLTTGRLVVPRDTQELIDNADSDARTVQERAVVKLLSDLFLLKLAINRNRDSFRKSAEAFSDIVDAGTLATVADSQPATKDMLARQSACSNALDSILRMRTLVDTPKECSNLADAGTWYH
jgi:hypothetical protein